MAFPIAPPLKPMLAKLSDDIPRGDGWSYEPKWDGFRAIVFRDGDRIEIRSRNDRPMNRYFPEVADALSSALPAACVVDGEIVLATDGGLDFDALQLRLHPAASRVELLAGETPASFVAFDLCADASGALLDRPLSDRWDRLARALPDAAPADPSDPATVPGPHVWLTPRTLDPDEAARWFDDLEEVGLDGLIAKRLDLPYRPGDRVMVKVKHRRTADCVVVGFRLSKAGDGVGSLLLGVYEDGTLHYVGHTSSFKAAERRKLLEMLRPFEQEVDPDEMGRMPGGPSRWTQGRELEWHSLEPVLVCEVSYDFLQQGRFRHAARFLRWRDDKRPEECTFEGLRRKGR